MKLLLIFSLLTYLASAKVSCPPGFALVNNNKCLSIISDHYKHLEAEQKCTGNGGTLVNIHNAIDNRGVANFAGAAVAQYIWLGVFCFDNEITSCYSDDGSGPITYANFAQGHPQVFQQGGGCVYMQTYGPDKGTWFTSPCAARGMAFVCEVPTTVEDPTCTHNYNGYCYYPSSEIRLHPSQLSRSSGSPFLYAKSVCETSLNAQILSIHSRMELDYIRSLYNGKKVKNIILGAEDDGKSGNFKWSDGTDFDYDNSNPSDWKDKGNCLHMDVSDERVDNGLWSRVNCTDYTDFMCKREIKDTVVSLSQVKKVMKHKTINLADASHCNQTLFLAPGVVTSFDYLDKQAPPTFCTWNIGVLGAYRLGVYFTDFSLGDTLFIYDEFGKVLDDPHGTRAPYNVLAPTNIVKMTHNAAFDAEWSYHGFSATILPY